MKNPGYFKNKKITVIGLARSGLACAKLLHKLGAEVSVTDIQDSKTTRENALVLKSKGVKIELGRHTKEFIKDKDLLIISPGVPNGSLPLVWAKKFGVPVISEIEFAWRLCLGTVVAVTGSNGKTTVTTLIGKIIEAAGKKAFVCGNIGNPFSAEVEKIGKNDFVSLEVSSFQLQHIDKFKPKISVILNFTRNHLDWHKDMREYLEAKKRIFMNQDNGDNLVLNYDDPVLRKLSKQAKATVVFFRRKKNVDPNHEAVLCVGSILGIKKDLIRKVLAGFKGIEHRFEYVAEVNKIKFINDSKATTAPSAIWAIRNIPKPIILIAGGKDKGVDYSSILKYAAGKVKQAILIGEARKKIRSSLKKKLQIDEASSLEEAVRKAYCQARPGEYVLLSPMCSSFDMFANYEERGRVFKEAVRQLSAKG